MAHFAFYSIIRTLFRKIIQPLFFTLKTFDCQRKRLIILSDALQSSALNVHKQTTNEGHYS